MVDISNENKALCFEDSTPKPLYIFIYKDGNLIDVIDNNQIVLESLTINEGVLDGNNFELGSFVIPTISVKWENTGTRYKDMIAVPVQKIGDECVVYFDGIITKEELSDDEKFISVEISGMLAQQLDIDVLPLLKNYNGETLEYMLINALGEVGIAFRGLEKKFANNEFLIAFDFDNLPKKLTVAELLKQVGEFLGCHITTQFKRPLEFSSLYEDMRDYQVGFGSVIEFHRITSATAIAKSPTFSAKVPSGYKQIDYLQSTGTQFMTVGAVDSETTIKMVIQNHSIEQRYLFGTSDGTNEISLKVKNGTELIFKFGDIEDTFDVGSTLGELEIELNKYRLVVNGMSFYFYYGGDFSINVPFALFTCNKSGTVDSNMAICSLYSFSITKKIDGTDIDTAIDFVPVLKSLTETGLIRLDNNRYIGSLGETFYHPNPISAYTLPYYISKRIDKTNKINIGSIDVTTKFGNQRFYQKTWQNNAQAYSIKDNILFEALSAVSTQDCNKAMIDVASYLESLDFYTCDLQTVYPLFIENTDYLMIPHKNQKLLPNDTVALESLTFKSNMETSSHPYVRILNIAANEYEIFISFALLGDESVVLDSGINTDKIFRVIYYENTLNLFVGNYVSGQAPNVSIPNVPKNKKIDLGIKVTTNKLYYYGTYNGEVEITNTNETQIAINVGSKRSGSNFKFYLVKYKMPNEDYVSYLPAYSADGIELFSPENGTQALVVYDSLTTPEFGSITVPILSCTTNGINSMKSDVFCKATNGNKN